MPGDVAARGAADAPERHHGWVRARKVQRASVRTRITVDLSERRVRLYRRGRLVLTSRAAVGSSATPTPLGRYDVNQRLVPRDASGPFGPGAVGISAFSPVLTGWAQGGPIAIHGTDEPWSIGRAVSNGCIRLPNRCCGAVQAGARRHAGADPALGGRLGGRIGGRSLHLDRGSSRGRQLLLVFPLLLVARFSRNSCSRFILLIVVRFAAAMGTSSRRCAAEPEGRCAHQP